MMLKMDAQKGAGGLIAKGTFTSDNTAKEIACGFKPKYVAVVFQGSSGSVSSQVNGACRCIYDEDMSDTYFYRGSVTSGGAAYCQTLQMVDKGGTTTGAVEIQGITSNGFKFLGGTGSYAGTCYFFAIG